MEERCTAEEMRKRLLQAWKDDAGEYRMLIPTYKKLLEEKRALRLRLNPISKSTLKNFVKITLFECENEDQATKYIESLSSSELSRCLNVIEDIKYNNVYNTLKSRIYDYTRQLEPLEKKPFGVDPTRQTCSFFHGKMPQRGGGGVN